jgi:hypothetical protein
MMYHMLPQPCTYAVRHASAVRRHSELVPCTSRDTKNETSRQLVFAFLGRTTMANVQMYALKSLSYSP